MRDLLREYRRSTAFWRTEASRTLLRGAKARLGGEMGVTAAR